MESKENLLTDVKDSTPHPKKTQIISP